MRFYDGVQIFRTKFEKKKQQDCHLVLDTVHISKTDSK
jgi:hypothetical protein